jgi:hypothetical protein
MKSASPFVLCALLFGLSIAIAADADEGLWLFNEPPLEQLPDIIFRQMRPGSSTCKKAVYGLTMEGADHLFRLTDWSSPIITSDPTRSSRLAGLNTTI